MSLSLEFTPHSWYYGFAIKKDYITVTNHDNTYSTVTHWHAYTDNGMTGYVDSIEDEPTLLSLKTAIKRYHGICVAQGCKKTNIDTSGVCPSHR